MFATPSNFEAVHKEFFDTELGKLFFMYEELLTELGYDMAYYDVDAPEIQATLDTARNVRFSIITKLLEKAN